MISGLDTVFIGLYIIGLIVVTFWKKSPQRSETDFLLAGRKLTLPAFTATLVSTWYGGILGVGEFGYQYGLAQWIVFSLPYYLFALFYAFFLVKPIRNTAFLSIPEAVQSTYGSKAGKLSASFIFLLANPAPYFVMIAVLAGFMFPNSISYEFWVIFAALFSMIYVISGGFQAVVRTDLIQFVLMYFGFATLLVYAIQAVDSVREVLFSLPETLLSPTGGESFSYVLVWFFIALWTFADPGFHQRVSAAESEKTAKRGILVSVGFWMLFDIMTVSSSLLGHYFLPELENPMLIYPELGNLLLPSGMKGLFFLGLLATIMSTADSFLFLSGQSISRDLWKNSGSVWITRLGIGVSAIIGMVLAISFPSVIHLWYGLGSCLIPALLLAVFGTYVPAFRLQQKALFRLMLISFLTSLSWLWLNYLEISTIVQIEPFYPGLGVALMGFGLFRNAKTES